MSDQVFQKKSSLLEAMADGVYVIGHDLNVRYMNRAMIAVFGDGCGKPCFQMINGYQDRCPWCRADEVFDGQSVQQEIFVPSANKSFDVIMAPLNNDDGSLSMISIYRDITHRKAHEKKIKAREQDYRSLFAHVGCGVFLSSREGKFIDANPAMLAMLGYETKQDFLQMDIARDLYVRPEDRDRYMALVEKDGKVTDYDVAFKQRDGTPVPVLLTANVRRDADGRILGYEGIVADQTERIKMERKLITTREQLLQSEKLAAMGRLTSQLAHELNNPLYGIMNTLELLKIDVSPQSRRRRVLEMALSEIVRLSDMLRKMLSFSKPDQEEKQPVDINTVIDEILLLHNKQLQEHSIRVKSDFADGLGMVMASRNQLRQVFLNMVANARDAMPQGGTFSVTTSGGGDAVVITLSDTGVGIRPDHIDKIFDTFFTTKDSVKGVGLGLSVCYGFIRDHGGDIAVTSHLDQGTTFTVRLPVCRPA